jgi:hypothetical protein
MAAESYIKWDGQEDNLEPESRDDIYIVLARGYSRTMATLQHDKDSNGGNVICMSEVAGGWTKAFETLFSNQEDPEFTDYVCAEIEHNLVDEVKDFVEEIMAIFEHFECIECLASISPLEVEIQYLWTSENRIRIQIQNDFVDNLCRLKLVDDDELEESEDMEEANDSHNSCDPCDSEMVEASACHCENGNEPMDGVAGGGDGEWRSSAERHMENASGSGNDADESDESDEETAAIVGEEEDEEIVFDKDDVIEELREVKKWLEVATELYLIHGGRACSHRWETFINMNFKNPEQFRAMVESSMTDDE